jgi:alkanesulfonate monooxygenase SsuD/methylene tetrahydromethanopterin reductase-like flavin-dependent oxidoreductase (luciferase family)
VAVAALQRYLIHQHHDAGRHTDEIVHLFAERQQLWFGTPDDLVQLIERYQTRISSEHFVFWLDFGGMQPKFVRRSMQLLAREVIPHFREPGN